MTTLPEVTYSEDFYTFNWEYEGVCATLERFVEEKTDIRAELTVTSEHPTHGGQLYYGRLLLMGPQARAQVRTALEKRDPDLDWGGMLEQICTASVRRYREGAPAVDLWVDDLGDAGKYLVRPFVFDDAVNIIYGPGDCVSGDTLIEGPDGKRRADSLTDAPHRVWALGSNGVSAAWASHTWVKGEAALYEFVLASGQRIKVAEGHRFLTHRGWVFARDLNVGDVVCVQRRVGVYAPHLTSSERAQPELNAGVRRSMQRAVGSTVRCSTCCRRCGQPLLPALGNDLVPVPSRLDARARTRSMSNMGETACSTAHTHPYRLSGLRCNDDCVPAVRRAGVEESHSAPSRSALPSDYTQAREPFQRASVGLLPTHESGRLGDRDEAAASLLLPWTSDSAIVAKSIVAHQEFYDLSVPGYGNYLANGIWNHNSGKSLDCLLLAVAVASGEEVAGLIAERSGPVLYLDWEDSAVTHQERLRALCKGLGLELAPGQMIYRRMDASLVEGAREARKDIARFGITMVVVDSLGMACGGDPSDAGGIIRTMLAARSLGVPVVCIHHIAKDAKDKSTPYGSVYASNEARMSWLVEAERDGDTLVQSLTNYKANRGARHPRQSFKFYFQSDDMERITRIAVEPATYVESREVGVSGQKWKIAEYLNATGKAQVEDIAAAIGTSRDTARRVLNRGEGEMFGKEKGDSGTVWFSLARRDNVPPLSRDGVPGGTGQPAPLGAVPPPVPLHNEEEENALPEGEAPF